MPRPVLFVLAGVNGAGKSSIGGHLLRSAGMAWFNPDSFARALVEQGGYDQTAANALAWVEGMRRLDAALAAGHHHAFETTLGGNTVPRKLRQACESHDVMVWFCGLASPEQHLARVRARVLSGGHDIPAAKVRERWPRALANLIGLMPYLAHLQVYDNSAEAARGEAIADPLLVLEMVGGRLLQPAADDLARLAATPAWAKPLLEAALEAGSGHATH